MYLERICVFSKKRIQFFESLLASPPPSQPTSEVFSADFCANLIGRMNDSNSSRSNWIRQLIPPDFRGLCPSVSASRAKKGYHYQQYNGIPALRVLEFGHKLGI